MTDVLRRTRAGVPLDEGDIIIRDDGHSALIETKCGSRKRIAPMGTEIPPPGLAHE